MTSKMAASLSCTHGAATPPAVLAAQAQANSSEHARYICWSGVKGRGISVGFKASSTVLDFYFRQGKLGELWNLEHRNTARPAYFPTRVAMGAVLEDASGFLDTIFGPLETELFLDELRRVLLCLPVWPHPHRVGNFVGPEGTFIYLHRNRDHDRV